jgi:hypothetical protein
MDIYIGFDSAWTDNPKAPGAICAVGIEHGHPARFYAPQLVSFQQAIAFIQTVRSDNGTTLVALDQPTVVPNLASMRPVERDLATGYVVLPASPEVRGYLTERAREFSVAMDGMVPPSWPHPQLADRWNFARGASDPIAAVVVIGLVLHAPAQDGGPRTTKMSTMSTP